jgi:hypothetical protein
MITVFVVWVLILIVAVSLDKYIIPRLSPNNRFAKWWRKHLVDEDFEDRGPR